MLVVFKMISEQNRSITPPKINNKIIKCFKSDTLREKFTIVSWMRNSWENLERGGRLLRITVAENTTQWQLQYKGPKERTFLAKRAQEGQRGWSEVGKSWHKEWG